MNWSWILNYHFQISNRILLFYIICLFFAVRSLNPNLCATSWLMFLPSPPIINNQIRVYSVWVTITVPSLVWTASWVSGYSVISVLCDTPAKAHCISQSWDNEVWRKKDSLQSKTLQTIECVTVWKPSWHFRYALVSQCQPTCLQPLCCTVQNHFFHSLSMSPSLSVNIHSWKHIKYFASRILLNIVSIKWNILKCYTEHCLFICLHLINNHAKTMHLSILAFLKGNQPKLRFKIRLSSKEKSGVLYFGW